MIKTIYIYGDSFVAGDGVATEEAWPSVLAQRLGMTVINRGIPGGSNKLSTINLLNDFADIENLDEVLVVFSWTGIMRTAFYHKGLATWRNVLVGHDPEDPELKKICDLWYGSIYNDYDGQMEFYSQQIFVSSFLASRNVKYIFINSFIEDYIDKEAFAKQYKNVVKLLPKDKFILGYDGSIFDILCKRLKMICADGYHPSAEGHKHLANIVDIYLKDNNLL
jgi:lysophospholipase L1-like esterase